jgi:carbon storage regulator CsrA
MLVLTRKARESVVIGGSSGFQQKLKVTVLEIDGVKVRLGFEANKAVRIHRGEVWERLSQAQPASPKLDTQQK